MRLLSVYSPGIKYLFNTANPRLSMIRREETRMGSGVNIGYVSDAQMAWNVVNGSDRSFGIHLILYLILKPNFKNTCKTQFLVVGPSRKALMTWELGKLLIYFIKYSSWDIFG